MAPLVAGGVAAVEVVLEDKLVIYGQDEQADARPVLRSNIREPIVEVKLVLYACLESDDLAEVHKAVV